MVQQIQSIHQKLDLDGFLYPWEFFQRRLQEEIVRSRVNGASFGYLELPFADVAKCVGPQVDLEAAWREILLLLARSCRGNDIQGILEQGQGLGVVLLDSHEAGIVRLRHRLLVLLDALSGKAASSAGAASSTPLGPTESQNPQDALFPTLCFPRDMAT